MEDNKKPTFNVLFARGVVEQDYLEFLKKIFPDYNVVGIIRELNKSLPNVINLILFTGGEDVTPSFYGENKGKFTKNNRHRDDVEQDLFHRMYYQIPKLGICRG